jgi:glycosyltransferase involved in cell wall biosynthesis
MFDILLISDDVAGEKMAGPGIRAWELAKCLSVHFKVVLAIPDYSYQNESSGFFRNLPFALEFYSLQNPERMRALGEQSRIILLQGYILAKFPFLKELPAYLICDLYVPFALENLFVHKWKVPNLKDREFIHRNDLRVYNDQLIHGDHLLCASPRQKDLFVGGLLSLDRINPEILDLTPTLDDLISVVPFGIAEDEDEEERGEKVMRGRIPQIQDDDILLIWGGVITNWYDPLTLIRSFADALQKNPKLKMFFLAKKHPNPLLPDFDMAHEASRLAAEMGLSGKSVFFNEDWIAYKRRGLYFREADIGISIHRTHFETYYSFRIRLLDYLKYRLPIICTEGDYFADLVQKEGLGMVVGSENQSELTRAILALADNRGERDRIRDKQAEIKERFYWARTSQPLIDHCRKVLSGEVRKKNLPETKDITFVTNFGPEAAAPQSPHRHRLARKLLRKLPLPLSARIKRIAAKWIR